jgi:LuxR family maltose regulon positive regulatory protein
MIGIVDIGIAELLREWNDLDGATSRFAAGIARAERGGYTGLLRDGYLGLARVRQAQGDSADALTLLDKAEQLALQNDAPQAIAKVAAWRARLWLAQGQYTLATRWADEHRSRTKIASPDALEVEDMTLARVLIAQGGRALHAADAILERRHAAAERTARNGCLIEILALQALACWQQGDTPSAIACMREALALAEPEGYIRLFVDEGASMAALLQHTATQGIALEYVTKLLTAFCRTESTGLKTDSAGHSVHSPPSSSLVEPLTSREVDVLRLLAAGLPDQKIADQLHIGVGTARWHAKNIYGKLGVHNRTQAAARARAIGLLADAEPPI